MADLGNQLTIQDSVLQRSGDRKLTQRIVEVPDGVRVLDAGVFQDSPSLSRVILPRTLIIIRADAFRNCQELQSVELPEGLLQIEAGAFAECRKLKNVILPDGLNTIGDRAFAGCSSLRSFHVPASVTMMGRFPVFDCKNVSTFSLPEHLRVPGISDREVLGLPNEEGWLRWKSELYGYDGPAKKLPIPPGITHIREGALNRHGLTVTSLPYTIVSIESNSCFAGGQGEELLPDGYFQTLERLPAQQTLAFLTRRCTRLGPQLPDLAALWLYQRGLLQTAAIRLMQKWTVHEISDEILRQLAKSQRHRALGLAGAAMFWFLHPGELPEEYLRQASGDGAASAEQLPQQMVGAVLGESGIGAWQPAFGEVKLASGQGTAPPEMVKDAVASYLALGIAIRSGFGPQFAVPRDAERILQQLDRRSLAQAAERIFANVDAAKRPEQLLPMLRMGGERLAAEMIRQQQHSCSGEGGACSNVPFCRCFYEGITLSATDVALQWALRQTEAPCSALSGAGRDPFAAFMERQQQTQGLVSGAPKGLDLAEGVIRSYWGENGRLQAWLEWVDGAFQIRNAATGALTTTVPVFARADRDLQKVVAGDLQQTGTYHLLLCEWAERFFERSYRTGAGILGTTFMQLIRNPVLAHLLQGTVWMQQGKLFQVRGGQTADDLGSPVSVRPEELVLAAHPLEMKPLELQRWQKAAASDPDAPWRRQLYGPVYTPELLTRDRFAGFILKKSGSVEHDVWLDQVLKRPQPEDPINLGGGMRVGVKHVLAGGTLQLGRLEPGQINRESNHAMHVLDEATYSERVLKGDQSVATYLALLDPVEVKKRAARILSAGNPKLRSAVLEVCAQRHLAVDTH